MRVLSHGAPVVLLSVLFACLLACTGANGDSGGSGSITDSASGDSGNDSGSGTPAVLMLSFEMDEDLLDQMDEPPVGLFRGSIYREEDATAIGNNEGAESLVDFTSDPLDLSDGGESGIAWTSGDLEPQTLWILGCLDSDANDCECGDPITVPNDNKVVVASGPNDIIVKMELLLPC